MKNLFALIVAAVMLLIMTASVAALPAPSAGVQPISAYDLVGVSVEEFCGVFERAGYYYVVLGDDETDNIDDDFAYDDIGFAIRDTRPGENPLPKLSIDYGGYKGGDKYFNLVNIYSPTDLNNAILFYDGISVYKGYDEFCNETSELCFDNQRVAINDYVVDPLGVFYAGMTAEDALAAANRMGFKYTLRRNHLSDDRVGEGMWLYITDGKYEYCLILSDGVAIRIYVAKHEHSELGYDSDTDLGYGYGDVDYFNWDLNNHWRSCLCGETFDFGEHDFLNGRCKVCGATEGVVPEAHAHDNDNLYDNYIYYSAENGHYKVCHACGSVQYSSFEEHYISSDTGKCDYCDFIDTGYIHDHVYEYTYLDYNKHIYDCIYCDYRWTQSHKDRDENYVYTKKDNMFHYYICTKCNEPVVERHVYYGGKCEYCSYVPIEHEHDYQWVGYDRYQYCVICGKMGNENHRHTGDTWEITPEKHTLMCSICGTEANGIGKHEYVFDTCVWCKYTRGTITFLPGDLNSSGGNPDVSDGVVMQRILASLEPEITAADLNHDGIVNVADGVVMQRILAGLE